MSSSGHSVRPSYPQHQGAASTTSSSASSSVYQSSSSLPSLVLPTVNSSSRQAAPLPSPISQQAPQWGAVHPSTHQQSHRASSYEYKPDRSTAGGTAAETGQFLSQYSLLAEAAKRAQMAVLARDMESMEF